jgi:hypothetical protein
MLEILRDKAKSILRQSNAEYLGTMRRLILFRSRETGATLAMHIDRILDGGPAAVREHIRESDARHQIAAL